MISVALAAMILVSAYLCLNSAISSQKLIEPRAEVLQSARVAMAMLSADLRGACPLSKDFEFVGMHRSLGDFDADNLDFATHNYSPRRAREGDFCEVSYFVETNTNSGRLSLWRRRNPTIAPDPLVGGTREEIAGGLRGVRFEYYDGLDWYDTWGDTDGRRKEKNSSLTAANLAGLPEAVRITLSFDPNTDAKAKGLADKSEDNNEAGEPPLVFQTIARLNLAGMVNRASSGGSSTNSGPANPQTMPGQEPETAGGN